MKTYDRIPELDILRGMAVLCMVFDHAMYDLAFLLPGFFAERPAASVLAVGYWGWGVRKAVRYGVLAVFLVLTGVCCSFSHSNLRRGLRLMLAALALTAATWALGRLLGDSEMLVTFGVLHCIALALVLIGLLECIAEDPRLYLALGLVLTLAGIMLFSGAEHLRYAEDGILPALLGQLTGTATAGSDSFPFPLFGGQVFLGVWLGKVLYPARRSLLPGRAYPRDFITFAGRNSLAVYFAHQILLPPLLAGLLLLCGHALAL